MIKKGVCKKGRSGEGKQEEGYTDMKWQMRRDENPSRKKKNRNMK